MRWHGLRLPVWPGLIRLVAAALLAAAVPAAAQAPSATMSDEVFEASARQERLRLKQQREAMNQDFRAQEQQCRQRFWVNACLGGVAEREREAVSVLRQRELQVDQIERQRRYEAALTRAAQAQRQQAERAPTESQEQAAHRRQQELQSLEHERDRRQAEAASRAAQQRSREADLERRRQAREEAARRQPPRADQAGPAAGP
jgi:hypothetical protein